MLNDFLQAILDEVSQGRLEECQFVPHPVFLPVDGRYLCAIEHLRYFGEDMMCLLNFRPCNVIPFSCDHELSDHLGKVIFQSFLDGSRDGLKSLSLIPLGLLCIACRGRRGQSDGFGKGQHNRIGDFVEDE